MTDNRCRQTQLMLPLIETIAENPDGLSAADAIDAVAAKIGLDDDERRRQVKIASRSFGLFARDVRWAREKCKQAGQIDASVRNLWKLTPKGRKDLQNASAGIVITVFETASGRAIWAEAESAFGIIDDSTVNLWITSPPYDIRRQKEYGGHSGDEYLEWLAALCSEMNRTLTDDGSLVLNLGDAFLPGRPVMSLYQERLILKLVDDLGFRLAQKLVWHNPSRMPSPAEWVTVRRCRVTPATENLWWLAKSDFPKADNRRALRPYSDSMKKLLARGGGTSRTRPSGHILGDGAFSSDRGGSIAHNIITAANTSSNDVYQRYCREHGLPIHPARFPAALAEFPIKLLTEPGDLVADCFAGSCTTGAVAQDLGRRWIGIERSLTYLKGAIGRFDDAKELLAR